MHKSNLRSLLTEAASAEHEAILTNKSTTVATGTATRYNPDKPKNLPSTRTRTEFTRMSIIKARHGFLWQVSTYTQKGTKL